MATEAPSRDELAAKYLDQLPYPPYPVQEEALLAWFTSDEGVMVCAPTGTGKTVIAEAALFEALHTGTVAYYTTPLIALTEQKFREMQAAAVRWGFQADDVGLVTGNRTRQPQRPRSSSSSPRSCSTGCCTRTAFDFAERRDGGDGRVPQLRRPASAASCGSCRWRCFPSTFACCLLSATVGNAVEFIVWLNRSHGRKLQLVAEHGAQDPADLPLGADELLNEQLERDGRRATRPIARTPALVFCFNRDECWSRRRAAQGQEPARRRSAEARWTKRWTQHDWPKGVGPKLKQMLQRGVGVHHAGMLPKYRRIVEELFETQAALRLRLHGDAGCGHQSAGPVGGVDDAGEGAAGKKKLIDPSTAHQMFGRAGRPQFDTEGYVYALAHEDDVRILRFKERTIRFPRTPKTPALIKAQEALKSRCRRGARPKNIGSEVHFEKLKDGPAGQALQQGAAALAAVGLLAGDFARRRKAARVVRKRLMDAPRIEAGQKQLQRMLMSLWAGGFVRLEPEPPPSEEALAASRRQVRPERDHSVEGASARWSWDHSDHC